MMVKIATHTNCLTFDLNAGLHKYCSSFAGILPEVPDVTFVTTDTIIIVAGSIACSLVRISLIDHNVYYWLISPVLPMFACTFA